MVWVKRMVIHHIPKLEVDELTSTTSRVIAISVKKVFFEILKMSQIFEFVHNKGIKFVLLQI